MRNSRFSTTIAVLIVLACVSPGWAQQTTPTASPAAAGVNAPRKVANAARVTEAPIIDGVLDEGVWRSAKPMSEFTQAEPLEGQPASENTEVRILYDNEAIFIGAILHDRDVSQIVTTDTRRDSDLEDQDSFQVIFDTFHDRQNGFVFGTNASGVQWDGQVRSQGGASASWDGSWEVQTNITEAGWTAEIRIPLRTLRYGPPPQAWGVNFQRNLPRTRERAYWTPLQRIFDIGRLSSAGDLQGLDLTAPRNFKLLPYVIRAANRNFTPGAKAEWNKWKDAFGFDAKFGVTGSLNLDVTYNTDFAQVEVDTQQINLTRFNLRFPEKRPFFLENSGLFTVGKGQDLDLFFSRSIGISDDLSLVPIRGGARLSGKANGLNVGVLNIQTEEVGTPLTSTYTPGNNFTALRASRDLPSRSGVGAIFVNRSAVGSFAGPDNWNRTFGLDARTGIGERATLSGFAARTQTPNFTGRQYAYNVDTEYDDGQNRMNFEYGVTGEAFNPEVGFLRQEGGYRRMNLNFNNVSRQAWIRAMGFREFNPHANFTRYDYLDGRGLLTGDLHVDNHFDWENGFFISPALNVDFEGLEEPFEVYPDIWVPAGNYTTPRLTFRMNSDQRKWLFGRLQYDLGGFLNGNQQAFLHAFTIRQGGTFTWTGSWTRTNIQLPQGSFQTDLANTRLTYNFTPSIFTQSLIQYNTRSQRWSTNLRFHVLETAGTGLFVVYNDTESMDGNGPVNRAFIVKYVRQFDLLQ